MRKVVIAICFISLVFPHLLPSATINKEDLLKNVRQYWQSHQHRIIKEFFSLLSIPNVAADKENIRKNANFIKDMMERYGVKSKVLESAGNPLVYGEYNVPGAKRTLLFYVHYDGQPVDSSQWTGTKPFTPALPHPLLFLFPKPVNHLIPTGVSTHVRPVMTRHPLLRCFTHWRP